MLLPALAALVLAGCAYGLRSDPVQVTVSVLRMVRQLIGLLDGELVDTISYQLNGKLSGRPFHTVRFGSLGEFTLPTAAPANVPGAFSRPEPAGAGNASPLSR